MSYILDALKKSETERRQQQTFNASGDFSTPEVLPQAESKRSLLVVVVVLLVVTNFAVLAYLWLSNNTNEEVAVVSDDAQAPQPNLMVQPVVEKREVTHEEPVNAVSAAGPQLDIYQTPPRFKSAVNYSDQNVITPPSRPSAERVPEAQTVNEPMVIKPGNGLVERYHQSVADSALPKHNLVNLSSGQPSYHPSLEPVNTPQSNVNEVIKPQAVHQNTVERAHSSDHINITDLPTINDLAPNDQARLPELTFTSHLYSSNPNARSVRFSGQKFREGDGISKDLRLSQITEDGVVLELSGMPFYMSSYQDWVPR